MGGCEQCIENKLYSSRKSMGAGTKNILGTPKSGLRIIGKANQFSKKMGVSSSAMNNMSNALLQLASQA